MRLYRELEFFLPPGLARGSHRERRLYDFPAYDISPLSGLSPQKELVSRRIQALYALTHLPGSVVVSSVEAAAVRIMPKKALAQGLDYLEAGEEIDREAILRRLFEIGYTRTSLVEERGDFAVRGGVVDVFPPLYSEPVRIELWGDQIESIRHFDALSQRSTEDLDELVLLPASEILLREENVRRARSLGRLPGGTREGGGFPGQEAWLSHYYPELSSLLDYLPDQGLLVRIEPASIKQGLERFKERFFRDVERYRQDAEEREQPFPEVQGLLMEEIHPPAEDGGRRFIDFMELSVEAPGPGVETVHIQGATGIQDSLELRVEGKGTISMAPLAESAERWIEQGSRVVLVSRTDQQARRLREILANYGMEAEETAGSWSEVASGRGLSLCLGRLSRGFAWPAMGLHVVSEDEIFGPKQVRPGRKRRPGLEGLTWTSFSRLQIGDPVVHEDHGIGLYGGLVKMEVEDRANDFVVVDYEGGDRLYVPADRISILQKYVGAEDKAPKLDRLGGRSWDIAKRKAKKSVKEIARQLVEIYALRSYKQGHAFGPPDNSFREFEAGFEHEETAGQVKAIEDVLDDMQSERPMDRLVCGDVGFGKTEVAVRAAFKAVSEGKQVAVLVPTTVLAEQHFETFRSRMEPYGVRVGVLSRFKSRSEQKDLVARVRSGKIDVIIGTHRLLQKDVGFMDLGLLVVDEEQRFGVKQKEAIKRYRALVDVLALAATPIPRTLHLSLMGVRDLSLIETPPEERKAIQTHILPYDEAAVVHAVEREMERGGQVFFVHNRVQTIKSTAARLQELLPSARVAVAHGQMREQDLEETMIRFVRREIDLLVCTTIIESGLDIP
ncbi:MAG: transcription-repair coupling factor, partial [Desulfobacteraceae bacterium]